MLGASYVRLVLARWRLVLALVAGCTLLAWAVTTFYLAERPTFEASARLNIVPTSEELGYANRFVRGSTFDGGSTLLGTYAEFAHTRPVVTPIVNRFVAEQAAAAGMSEQAWIAANSAGPSFSPGRLLAILNYGSAPVVPLRTEMIDELIEKTTIETVEGTYLMQLTVEWDDPKAAAWFANALADAIIARAERMSQKSGTQIAGTLEARLAEKQTELAAVLKRSRDTKAAVGVVDVDRQKQSLLEAQLAEQSLLTSDRAQLQSNQSQVAGLRSQTGGKMSTAQAAIEERLALEGPRAAGLQRGLAVREGRVAQIRGQIDRLGRHEDAIRQLDDRALQLRAEVAALTERVSFSQTENLANGPRIQLIERAQPPLTRSSPKMLFNVALGFIAGCALAGIALLILGVPAPQAVAAEEQADAPEGAVATPSTAAATPAPAPTHSPVGARPIVRGPVGEGDARVVDIPRPAINPAVSGAAMPAFASHGALALARPEPASVPIAPLALVPAIEPAPELEPEPESEPTSEIAPDRQPEQTPVSSPSEAVTARGPAEVVFGFVLPEPRSDRRYDAAEVTGIGGHIAAWLGTALDGAAPLTIAAGGDPADAQLLYQLLYDHQRRSRDVATVDWSEGARALPRHAGKPMIYAGGGFGSGAILAHRDGAVLVAVRGEDADMLEAEARRLATFAGRPVHVVPLAG